LIGGIRHQDLRRDGRHAIPRMGDRMGAEGECEGNGGDDLILDSANHVADRIEPALLPNLAIEDSAAIALCCAFLVPGP